MTAAPERAAPSAGLISTIRALLEHSLLILPLLPVIYLACWQDGTLKFASPLVHEVVILIIVLAGAGIGYVSWLSYLGSGEIFAKRLTLGFTAFALTYAFYRSKK